MNEYVSSPTFAIVNEYKSLNNENIFHFDFYRIKNISELIDIGIFEYFESGSYCFIEWTENAESILPEKYLRVKIDIVNENEREVIIETNN